MSYCRWSDDSDVYVYYDGTCYVCTRCNLNPTGEDDTALTPELMHAHLMHHRAEGDRVPDEALARLQCDVANGGYTMPSLADLLAPLKGD